MEKEKNEKIQIEGIAESKESLVNALRRSLNEIPVLAIDEVEISKNDSALYDEVLAHRIGLIPIKNSKLLTEKEKCSCKGKGCGKCTINLKISIKGPCTVYSGDIKGGAEVVYKKMPIVTLDKEQELELVGKVRLGKGKEHAKFSPGLIFYRKLFEIEIPKDKLELFERCNHGKGIVQEKKVGNKVIAKIDMCDVCFEQIIEENKASMNLKPLNEVILFVESFGQIKVEKLLEEAVKSIKGNLANLEKSLK